MNCKDAKGYQGADTPHGDLAGLRDWMTPKPTIRTETYADQLTPESIPM